MTAWCVKETSVEYRQKLLGTEVRKPRFSWKTASDRRGVLQSAYQIQVAKEDFSFTTLLWDTGKVQSEEAILIPYEGCELQSKTRYYYRIKVWDDLSSESPWSDIDFFETAFLNGGEWQAAWITPHPEQIDPSEEASYLLRKSFVLNKDIASARMYCTSAGLYELYINEHRASEDLLTPGWTSYHHRLQYQTYDITKELKQGNNAIGMMLADGWYKGELGWGGHKNLYGNRRAARLELHVRYDDGTEDIIKTDTTWRANIGAIRYSEIYHGERYDARLEVEGWAGSTYDDTAWYEVTEADQVPNNLVAQENWPVRITETLSPAGYVVTPEGDYVLDMGQNMVGRIRFTVEADEGTRIVLSHAEVLDKEGNFYTDNLRTAKQQVEYIVKGKGPESYAPHFTFQGFRYVKIEGYPGLEQDFPLESFVGEVMHSDMPRTGMFQCSHPLLNQLQSNIVWGQRGNFVDVPTDCPQRDERLGWTGDAQVFVNTALFNYQGAPFFTKWLRDVKADQGEDGSVPSVIPSIGDIPVSSAWGDAAVIIPWALYQQYGDVRILEEQYESMKAWVEYIRAQGEEEYLWNTGFHFGDWLGLDAHENSYDGATPKDLIATAYYAHSTKIVRDTAAVLQLEDYQMYAELHQRIVDTFLEEFVTPRGRLIADTQTAHVLAIAFGLVEGEVKERMEQHLNQLIEDQKDHLTTGFVGTPYLCFALSTGGYTDTAYRLLMQTSYPSWLYPVIKGATTIWEHWDGIKEDGTFWSRDMNSFNHYAYGAIGDYMYRVVAGLDRDPNIPGYKKIVIKPAIQESSGITHAEASYESEYGFIRSAWRLEEDHVIIEASIPSNTTAEVILPALSSQADRKGQDESFDKEEGIISVEYTPQGTVVSVGSGNYQWNIPFYSK
ncbi:alpha-L-rhamnosidase [Paenibacillus sp. Marseille-Q4541]|uniref:alpha-L-rhamnosidase n=1 Tax=Paenibacillus sp. Marseille-Q4541 TaxID=2831522 RepID=UPI001BAB67DF|nr:alpha-L-rhamnosidase [Paenibacillus sp. Marseille-Q4541]